MKIGIFGGTFSPVHNGHIVTAREFVSQLKLDKLYVIPNNKPPHKEAVDGADAKARLDMLKLAFDGMDKIFVSTIELERGGKSYTVDTLETLKDQGELYMLCGSDMFLSLETWRRHEDIFKLTNIVLGRRESEKEVLGDIENQKRRLKEYYSAQVEEIYFEPVEISSSEIREYVKNGKRIDAFVPKNVEEYIYKNKLYT